MIGKLRELLKLHSPRQFAGYVVLGAVMICSSSSLAAMISWTFKPCGGWIGVTGSDLKQSDLVKYTDVYEYDTSNLILKHDDPVKKCAGWYGDSEYKFKRGLHGDKLTVPGAHWARWVDDEYPVYFVSNFDSDQIVTQKVVATRNITLNRNTFSRSDCRFLGWSRDRTAKSETWKDGASGINLDPYRDRSNKQTRDVYGDYVYPVTLYAVWMKQYTILFEPNGGSGAMGDLVLDEGVETSLPACSFAPPDGKKFATWKASNELGEYKDGATLKYDSNNSRWSGNCVTFYAQWTAIQYKIAFHANGGRGTMSEMPIVYGGLVTLRKCEFYRWGYLFEGWAKTENGPVVYRDNEKVDDLTTEDGKTIDLYARWKPINYFIRFDANGGVGGSMGVMACEYDKSYTLTKNTYTREGSDFLGWSTNGSTSVAFEDGANFSNLSTVANSTNVLRAVWSNYPYQIAFDGNGGDGEISNISCEYGTVYQLPSNAFTRIGYIFTGWATNATTAAVYAEGAAVSNLTLKVDETVRFYAAWRPITYRILFDADGGEGVMPPMTNVYDVAANLPPNAFSDIGMVFTGWALAPSGEVHYADCAQILNLTTEEDDEIVFYASWRQDINDLNAALDNNKLIFVRNGIEENVTVTNDASFVNGSCVKAVSGPATTDQSGIKIVLETPGELQFSWKVANDQEFENKNQGWHMRVYEVVGDSRLSMYDCAQPKGQPNMVSWSNAVISVTNETAMIEVLVDWYEGNSSAPYPYVLLDKVRFSTGDNPEPEPADAPVINGAASVEGGRFRVSFAADGRFKYELIKTESLSPVNWQSFSPQLFLTPDADGTVSFEPEMESSKPNMFYRVKVLKKD